MWETNIVETQQKRTAAILQRCKSRCGCLHMYALVTFSQVLFKEKERFTLTPISVPSVSVSIIDQYILSDLKLTIVWLWSESAEYHTWTKVYDYSLTVLSTTYVSHAPTVFSFRAGIKQHILCKVLTVVCHTVLYIHQTLAYPEPVIA